MSRLAVLALLLLVPGAHPLAGQACGLATGTAGRAAAGAVGYEIGDGLTGLSAGLDLEGVIASADHLELRLGYRAFVFGDGPDPHVGRLAAALPLPLPTVGGFALCVTGHVGGSLLPADQGTVTVAAGGAGLRLVRPVGVGAELTVPFIEVRGLAGASAGELGGIGVEASARSVGVAAGVATRLGPVRLRVAGAMDGFPAGLGVTPYPWWTGEASVGIRF
jgi:hypothetical protein